MMPKRKSCYKVTYVNPDTGRRETYRDRSGKVVVYKTFTGASNRGFQIDAAGAWGVQPVPTSCKGTK